MGLGGGLDRFRVSGGEGCGFPGLVFVRPTETLN